MRNRVLPLLLLVAGSCSTAVLAPPKPTYFYYLHGKIVEDLGPRGLSSGLTVVSEVRPKDTDPSAYADRLVADIRARLRAGVAPSRITVAGSSKGSVIASLVSTRLNVPGVRYVLIANCNDRLLREIKPRLTGDILSIYEASDDIGQSCAPVIAASPAAGRFEEVRLTTGLGHGVVYRPLSV